MLEENPLKVKKRTALPKKSMSNDELAMIAAEDSYYAEKIRLEQSFKTFDYTKPDCKLQILTDSCTIPKVI